MQPDTDWASLDGMASQPTPTEWLEVPLKGSDRRGPPTFTCAVTIPSPATFNRSPGSAVPYFVVFTTTPRDPDLAREIASDATIAVSLVRVVSANSEASAPIPSSAPPQRRTRAGSISNWLNRDSVAISEPSSPSSEEMGNEGDAPQSKTGNGRSRLLDRMVRSAPPPLRNRKPSISQLQTSSRPSTPGPASAMQPGSSGLASAPPSPPPPVLDTRTLQTDVAVGFPKRPRHPGAKHPPLPGADSDGGLPDGLHKGQLYLAKDMLPGIEWTGLRIKVGIVYISLLHQLTRYCYSIILMCPCSMAKMNSVQGFRSEFIEIDLTGPAPRKPLPHCPPICHSCSYLESSSLFVCFIFLWFILCRFPGSNTH